MSSSNSNLDSAGRNPTRALSDAGHVLSQVLDRAAPGAVIAFDLDSTLLDNRPRSARIFREFAAAGGPPALLRAEPRHFVDWSLDRAMRNCGAAEDEIVRVTTALREFWMARFFTSEYCLEDIATPGAPGFVAEIARRGATVCYLTGRHEAMRAGTLRCFEREGFLLPDGERAHLLMKPSADIEDDAFKREAHGAVRGIGRLVAAFDNEPTHANDYRSSFPDALVVHLATDHSSRPVEVHTSVPSILDFTAFGGPVSAARAR